MYSVQKYFFLTPSVIRPQSVNNQWANPLSAPTVFGPTPGINIFPESAGRNECETGWPYHARLGLPVQSSNSAAHVRRPAMAGAIVRQRLSSRGEVARAGQSLALSRSATRAKDPILLQTEPEVCGHSENGHCTKHPICSGSKQGDPEFDCPINRPKNVDEL